MSYPAHQEDRQTPAPTLAIVSPELPGPKDIEMIFNIGIGLLVAWLAARKWSRLNGGLFLSCFMGFIIAWFAGGALSIAFSPDSHTDAAMAAMTTGLWFSLAGAAAGGYLGKLHGRWDERRGR